MIFCEFELEWNGSSGMGMGGMGIPVWGIFCSFGG